MSSFIEDIKTDAFGAITDIQLQGKNVFEKILAKLTIDNLMKYFIQGLAVAIAAYLIPNRKTSIKEVAIISAVSGLTFMLLDTFTDDVGKYARLGVGAGIGLNLVNMTSVPYLAMMGM